MDYTKLSPKNYVLLHYKYARCFLINKTYEISAMGREKIGVGNTANIAWQNAADIIRKENSK